MNELGGPISAITSLALLAVGTIVTFSSRRQAKGSGVYFFALLCLSLAAWVGANIMSDIDTQHSLLWVRASFASITAALFSFLMFVNRFPLPRYVGTVESIVHVALFSAMLGTIMLPDFIPTVTFSEGVSNVVPGVLYPVFLGYVSYTLSLALFRLVRNHKRLKGYHRIQAAYILMGVGAMAVISLITNLILPLIMGKNELYWVGSASSLLFVGAIGYSIFRHRLFDIRRAVVRGFAYLFTVTIVMIAYGFAFLIGITQFLGFNNIPLDRQLILLIVATGIGVSIAPLVRFFDRVTQRIFFRGSYDSQHAINEMTAIFTETTTLKGLLTESAKTLRRILGAESVTISLTTNQVGQYVAYSTLSDQSERPLPVLTQAHMLADQVDIVFSDELGDGDETLIDEMLAMSTAIVCELRSPSAIVGYVMIGYKKDGGSYVRRDLDFLDIVSDEFAIAIQSELRFQEIQEFNAELQHKIDDATSELQQSNHKLQQLDQAKDEFISMASHQLRTPLTTVKGYLSMVLEGDVGKVPPAQKKVLEQAYDSSQRMVYLIGDFLNVSRLQTGKFEMERMPSDLSKVIGEEIAQLQTSASSRKVTLSYHAPASFPILVVDENKLRQVMMNFIDNAIYYSKPDTTIDISLVQKAGEIVFKVVDHGIGVPIAERPQLFTKFYRASNAKKQRPDGTGIGLFMAKKVIVAHGGSVIFETKEGQGSTFGFRLPVEQA